MSFFCERLASRNTEVVKECLGALKSLCFSYFASLLLMCSLCYSVL